MPEDDTPQKEEQQHEEQEHEHEIPTCEIDTCEDDATWMLPYPDRTDYFCIFHAYEISINHAAMNLNKFQPMFFQAYPIHVHEDGIPSPAFLFVCHVGHLGRVFIVSTKGEFQIISFYRDCSNCNDIAEDLIENVNETMFGGKGKWEHRRNIDKRNIEVA
jgi:hypothetical protein